MTEHSTPSEGAGVAEEWQTTFDAIRDLVMILDREFRIVRVNAAAISFFNLPLEKILGSPCHCLMHGTTASLDGCPFEKAIRTRRHEEAEVYDEKRAVWLLVSVDPIFDPAGGVASIVHTVRDITGRKLAERALAESESFKSAILASLVSHVAVLDRAGTIIAVNEAWQRFARENGGMEADLGVGADYLAALGQAAQGGSAEAEQAMSGIRSVLDGSAPHFECEYACHSPTRQRWYFMTVSPLRRSQGGAVVAHRSITELKETQNSLQTALEENRRLKERVEAENVYLRQEVQESQEFGEIVGKSAALRLVLDAVSRVASTDATVLLLGETGTGKDLLARAIHAQSPRRDRALVSVNCAALPSTLIESELFGHEKGAFTGALARQVGRFELADGGTLLLDEIGELAPELQAKLLRVLQEGTFERLGASKTLRVDVRVLAATNRDLAEAVRQGGFRSDLYYRLNVFPIHIPPLRERREDIPLLVWHLITQKQRRLGKRIERISPEVMEALVAYDWPGNIRELENVIEHALILSSGPTLVVDEGFMLRRLSGSPPSGEQSLDDVERAHIRSVLEACHWKVKGPNNAAERLGLNPSTLYFRMKKLAITRSSS